MSYSRQFTRRIEAYYSGSKRVSYPASEHGGTMTVNYSGYTHEDVEVDIEIDTDPFDNSVEHCNNCVNGLTASVAAMNAAQCETVRECADKVSATIVKGFFDSVRTDLSAQKAELEQTVDSKLLLLRQQTATLREKRQTMEQDYARTSARYQKIFNDLNNELSVRVHEMDQPVFNLVKEVDEQSGRMLHTDMVQTAVTASKESSTLQAQIGAASVKNHALEAMNKARDFLAEKATSERTINNTTVEGSGEDRYLVPVCYMRTTSEKNENRKCMIPEYYSKGNAGMEERLCEKLDSFRFPENSSYEKEQLKSYVQTEMARSINGDDSHSNRVREMINKMLNK